MQKRISVKINNALFVLSVEEAENMFNLLDQWESHDCEQKVFEIKEYLFELINAIK
jgi:hypothetical protein